MLSTVIAIYKEALRTTSTLPCFFCIGTLFLHTLLFA